MQLDQTDNEKKDDAFLQKSTLITKQIKSLGKELSNGVAEGKRELESCQRKERQLRGRWTRELESGGNVRYIDGRGGDQQGWHESCVELVKSRFIAADFAVSGKY